MTAKAETKDAVVSVAIKPPNLQIAEFNVTGTAPYVQHRFWKKAEIMQAQQEGGTRRSKSKTAREARDFDADFEQAKYISTEGWYGIPAPSFRNAMISACRVAGFVMTRAKLSVFVVHDGIDRNDQTPLVRLTEGEPINHIAPVRNDNGSVDLRARPMFTEWGCTLRVRFDGDQFTRDDVANLLMRAGMQVGVGEGRPDSKESNGVGWGTFTILGGSN